MAGNKIHGKAKGKDYKGKANNKAASQPNEENENDLSVLRKPIHTCITGFGQARKIYDLATEELRGLLSNECDVLYECKVCRNIFRSLANYISHKRVFCKEKFSSSVHGHFIKPLSTLNEIMKIKRIEQEYQDFLNDRSEPGNGENMEIDDDERVPLTKDLTTVIEYITKTKGIKKANADEPLKIALQEIPNTGIAVFQNTETDNLQNYTLGDEMNELNALLSKTAVLQSNGQFKIDNKNLLKTGNVIQISDDEENGNSPVLICKVCDMHFLTLKTLKFHVNSKHLESRLVYPCPDCLEVFCNAWSVFRHLFKVHRKTPAQIKRMRETIQTKAFKMNNPPASYEKRKNIMKAAAAQKITEEERMEQENQSWIDNMEGDGELPRCGGCGRTFERRAALAAHTHTCQPRSRALARRPETKRIEIQIRKDYNKGPPALNLPAKSDANENKTIKDEKAEPNKVQKETEKDIQNTKVQNVKEEEVCIVEEKAKDNESQLDKEDNDLVESDKAVNENEQPEKDKVVDCTIENEILINDLMENDITENDTEVNDKVQDVNVETSKEVNSQEDNEMDISDDEIESIAASPEKPNEIRTVVEIHKNMIRLPFAQQDEKSNLIALRQRIQADIELDSLLCRKCDVKFNHIQELYDHIASHYNWMRYACKLCNYKHYYFDKLPEHVKIVHKLKGDKDFYYSTVKALNGIEALQLSKSWEANVSSNENSPESRRLSRCSSDSSRLSDDSTTSGLRTEGSRKRKMYQNKPSGKKRRESIVKVGKEKHDDLAPDKDIISISESVSSTNNRILEENSSDGSLDGMFDKLDKKPMEKPSAASQRPVRRKTKPKRADFEYDLSNLLKMEAQGYRDSVTTPKPNPPKKKLLNDNQLLNEINKDYNGALAALSGISVEKTAAHMRTSRLPIYSPKDSLPPNIFIRPLLPKGLTKNDKVSPKKDVTNDKNPSPNKEVTHSKISNEGQLINNENEVVKLSFNGKTFEESSKKDRMTPKDSTVDHVKPGPPVLPLKLPRQSLEVIKNPLINKNITELTKAGMKTKILVIKPINRIKDGTQAVNSPLKFQTIKLKDTSKSLTADEKSDQVLLVKVPTVDAVNRPVDISSGSKELHSITLKNKISDNNTKNNDLIKICETEPVGSKETNVTIGKESQVKEVIDESSNGKSVIPSNQSNTDANIKIGNNNTNIDTSISTEEPAIIIDLN